MVALATLRRVAGLSVAIALIVAPATALADAPQSMGALDTYLSAYETAADVIWTALGSEVTWITVGCVTLDFIFLGYAITKDDGPEFFDAMIMQTLFLGLIAFLEGSWVQITTQIHETLVQLGLQGSGFSTSDFFSPSTIAGIGMDVGNQIMDARDGGTIWGAVKLAFSPDVFLIVIAVILVIAAFAWLSICILYRVLVFKLFVVIGGLMLAFGNFRYTAFLAENTIPKIFASAIEMGTLAFICGIGVPAFKLIPTTNVSSISAACGLCVAAIGLAVLGTLAPGKISSLIGPGPGLKRSFR